MTYQLFLFTQNIAMCCDSHGEKIFKEHDVILCDEAHNIPGIVQQNYATNIIILSVLTIRFVNI